MTQRTPPPTASAGARRQEDEDPPDGGAPADLQSTLEDRRREPREGPRAPRSPEAALPGRSAGSREPARLSPGAQLADRYRIVELISRGSMGEVYRAEDLKLGQPVALKLLPPEVQDDPERLDRFFNEVRTARQVTHPNVCRVHDLREAEGLHFLSMELVDGEDLASLLRRIGRVPEAKALEIACQLCAGLAAVHEQGLLHRDLKPANVMIDGRGRARITDFGLAALAAAVRGPGAVAGTPAYMAPEQLVGEEFSLKSEIFSLGLVLYEVFTGRAAYAAGSLAELVELYRTSTPAPPSRLVQGLDPAVDQVILSCLEKEPAKRPRSVPAVAAALPGGDPLRAAVAAGETPSPELVAAAGETAGLQPRAAAACLLGAVLGLGLVVSLAGRTQLTGMAPLDKPPEVLVERAREVLREVGYPGPSVDSAYGFAADRRHLAYLEATDPSPRRWDRLGDEPPHPVRFWYRQSPIHLVPRDARWLGVTATDPPALIAGMVGVELDPQGRLRSLEAVPPEVDAAPGPGPEPDWAPLFAAAGLDRAAFEPAEPSWTPAAYADRRAAWRGAWPGSGTPVEVEAAAYRGRPVAFRLVEPWTAPSRTRRGAAGSWAASSHVIWFFASLLGGALVAGRNLRLGRGDRRAATRLALFVLAAGLLRWLLGAHHGGEPAMQFFVFKARLADTLYWCAALWMFYIAFEPYLRRLWPKILVSWIRLLDGRLRDPLVGRDVLVGCCWGLWVTGLMRLYQAASPWLGQAPPRPDSMALFPLVPSNYFELIALDGLRHDLWAILTLQLLSLVMAFMSVIGILLLRLLLRRTDLALATFFLACLTMFFMSPSGEGFSIGLMVLGTLLLLSLFFVLFRFGFLAVVVGYFVDYLLRGSPLTLDPSAWHVGAAALTLGVVLAMAIHGFRASLAGRPLFRDEIFAPAR